MMKEIIVPSLGESVSTGYLTAWLKHDGEYVREGEPLFELESDKANLEVPATATGRLSVITEEGAEVEIGAVVARVDTDAKEEAASEAAGTSDGPESADKAAEQPVQPETADTKASPAARRMMAEEGIHETDVPAGDTKRPLTKDDVLAALEQNAPFRSTGQQPSSSPAAGQERKPMSRIRQRIAANLVESKRNAAHLTTFNEINLGKIKAMRAQYQREFTGTHGIKLGFLSFFIQAACRALLKYPEANSFIDGGDIVYNHYCNIGIAVSTDRGLVVPVLKNAEFLTIDQIEYQIAELAEKARTKKLQLDDMSGGTFSITNGGIFGSLLSTPIPTPPQSAILGMHTIQDRPVAENGEVVIRPMMYVALTYDHRVMDGREAVGFLGTIKSLLESPEKLLLNL